MVPRLALLFVLGAAPAVVAADVRSSLLRGSAPESAQVESRRESLTRSLGDEDPKGGSYEHQGCFLDDKEDRILGSKLISFEMSTMACHTHCDGMGAAYMATQYGSECWCSMQGSLDYERHGDGFGKCDIYCNGAPSETCGGRNAFDLYKLDWAPASDSPEYKGCFMDMKNERLMDDMMTLDDMTPMLCREHCMGKGSVTYATQYGNECWCGTSPDVADYIKHGEGVCHMRCAGDSSVACGGYNSLSLFHMDGMEDDETSSPTSASTLETPAPSVMVETDKMDQPTAGEQPTAGPTVMKQPAAEPTMAPAAEPYTAPVAEPTMAPIAEPTMAPVAEPTMAPVAEPTMAPVAEPTAAPVAEPTAAPVAETTAQPTAAETDAKPDQPRESGGDAGEYAELLAIHNRKRCMHNADPLVWDTTIEETAKAYADVLTNSGNCGTIFHSTDNNYGENLLYCGNTSGYGCYSDEDAMTALFDDELTKNLATWGLHATAIACKSTERVGCAVATCEKNKDGRLYYYHTLVCNFDPPGNYMAKLRDEVELESKTEAQCS